ncbi:possible FYVE zinc finger [Prochlorococcus marinus str. MIT 9313]|uniref:Possible FYVE zinc finger n=1 Tax=Prochlorococcus marinus (strain MIT 9313) TaxID=74547 RepID=Q7V455_PROMM|nr:possible FYVE zinc finger [Prochlorococcus marinus str. MIT 9313]
MLVESSLASWSAEDSNNSRKAVMQTGKTLTWYCFPQTWIKLVLERGVAIATVCNNCDTSIQYIQEHYFQYGATHSTAALSTGRKRLKALFDKGWMP